jgi:hypothetical protein
MLHLRRLHPHVAAILAIAALTARAAAALAQQAADREYRPAISSPAYATGKGPVVCLDEAHDNFHTLDGRFWSFAELVRRDGFTIRASRAKLTAETLAGCGILVIANAQPSAAEWDSYPFPTPPAFAAEEVDATARWVANGGKLLLIADHMPLAGAAATLAAAFGVTFTDGFAVEGYAVESERDAAFAKPTIFRTSDSTLRSHPIVSGRQPSESIASVRTFTGQAFRATDAEPLLVLPDRFLILLPEKAWVFGPDTKRQPVGGWLQGAVLRRGAGRVAVFGEAAMFSAQVSGPARNPMGMNAPGAERNFQFVLNVMRWLAGLL